MVIAALVFLPIIISPFFYILGIRNEDLRDNCAIGFTFFELILSLLLAHRVIITGGAGLDIPGIFWGGLHFDVDGFRSIYSIITSVMWAGTTLRRPGQPGPLLAVRHPDSGSNAGCHALGRPHDDVRVL